MLKTLERLWSPKEILPLVLQGRGQGPVVAYALAYHFHHDPSIPSKGLVRCP